MKHYLPKKIEPPSKELNQSLNHEAVHLCYIKSLIETSGKGKNATGPSLLSTLCHHITPDKFEPLLEQFKAISLKGSPPPEKFAIDLTETANLRLQLKVNNGFLTAPVGSSTPHTL